MLLFSAVLLPEAIVASLRSHLDGLPDAGPGIRWVAPEQWHITLGFYGESGDPAEPASRAGWLRTALAGRAAPLVRLEGAGTFSHVLYVGVYSEGLAELAAAAGAQQEERPYLPHLTVARTKRMVPRELAHGLSGFASEPWEPAEAVLMRSDRTPQGAQYSVVERFPLVSRQAG
ncbi:RNA 2',3'-cyclic phosphodiesterase [Amycolatopsis rhizosphaerae]|uniref:RNA 2',3'-cyclic phosphodiesterase n=1 Tax=Amycolatopsis rhizosphaerae TaxID=2053003 RepID=A0A558CKJ4_9PSEU|nr:RNA 2',3'-cyclic phosphodiesterase [Amycolatopsis rhizosphaerae]TVT49276.1 RNA 2',3'-cyclic phosphodiesterase [Amycolatopsis rhizosphaerae]